MIFYSHSKVNEVGKVFGSKYLKEHTDGVLNKALFHYSENLELGLIDYELKELVKVIVKLHDLGKYTSYFQDYLLKRPFDNLLKQHARIGGFAAYNLLKEKNEKQALLALYLIFQHHSHLIALQDISEKLNDNLKNVIEHQQDNIQNAINQIQNDLEIANPAEIINYPEEKSIRKGLKLWAIRNSSIQDYYLINYLFSLLIEADKLDASDTQPYLIKKIQENAVDNRFGKLDTFTDDIDLKKMTNNELRNFCRAQVISNLEKSEILSHFLFTLTAPTGIGKTMTALDFALKLKAKISYTLSIEPRIIYALPFINIIEQALREYKDTLTEETEILAHYQYADVFSISKELKNEDGAELKYNQQLMTLDTWQADIVITSFVQFFETLIGNRNKLLKKFNHYANAIIILDEVQTLRLDQMPLIGAALFYLTKFLKARVILMTATKPKIFQLAQKQILSKEGDYANPLELLGCHEDVFATFQRTKIVPLIDTAFDKENVSTDFIEKVFSEKWQPDKSCIIVCNTVKRSIELYNSIVLYLDRKGLENTVEYLSTNIVPAHRFKRIKNIKNLIDSDRAPILISTQVVEAGVDLDFDLGFRDIGPIDSIIQVAGRINRNNDATKNHSPLYVVDFGDSQKIYGRITKDQAKSALQMKSEFLENEYLSLINKYFDSISDKKSFSEFNDVFYSMKTLRYDSERKEDRPVSSFKIIEESSAIQSVFIEIGEYEIELKEKYFKKVTGKIKKEEFDKRFKQDFQQRIISIPDYLTNELPSINQFDENIKIVSHKSLNQYYDEKTGFIRIKDEIITFL